MTSTGGNVYAGLKAGCREALLPVHHQLSAGSPVDAVIDDYFERDEALVSSERGKYMMRRRQVVIEGVFGEAKSWHLLGRALFRGSGKLKKRVLLTAGHPGGADV